MTFNNLHIKHKRTAEEKAWLKEETAEQEARFSELEQQMKALGPKRARWYQEFFDRISTIGFNVDGDDKVVIESLPIKPDGREDKVVWKHGIDGEGHAD